MSTLPRLRSDDLDLHFPKDLVHQEVLELRLVIVMNCIVWRAYIHKVYILTLSLVNIFVTWLYTQRLPASLREWRVSLGFRPEYNTIDDDFIIFDLCFQAYEFGDRCLISEFRRCINNSIIDAMPESYLQTEPFYRLVIHAFEYIPENREILQFLVDRYVDRYDGVDDGDEVIKMQKDLPRAFLIRVMRRYSEINRMYF